MELAKEKLDLIKDLIKLDKKYYNNEDLFDDFFNETYKRSFLIAKTVENKNSLEAYMKKIVATSMLLVLKDSGRVRRTKEGYIPTREKSIEEILLSKNRFANVQINYDIIDFKDGPEEIIMKKETLQTLLDAVAVAHSANPAKLYMQLYDLRYVKGLKQSQIAQELNLSQSEVSKRLLELMEKVKEVFNRD